VLVAATTEVVEHGVLFLLCLPTTIYPTLCSRTERCSLLHRRLKHMWVSVVSSALLFSSLCATLHMKYFKQRYVTEIETPVFLTRTFRWAHNVNVSVSLICVIFFPRTISHLNFCGGRAVEMDAASGHVAQRCHILQRCEHVLSACE